MAIVHIALSRVDDRGDTGGALPLITSVPEAVQTMTSTGTSSQSTIAADKADQRVWTIVSTGNVWISFGTSPDAGSGAGHLILAGQTRDFSVTIAGEKAAVQDVL